MHTHITDVSQSERHQIDCRETSTKQEHGQPRTPWKYWEAPLQHLRRTESSYPLHRPTCKPQLKIMRPGEHGHITSGLKQYGSPEQTTDYHGRSLCSGPIYGALENGLLPTLLRETLRQHGGPQKAEGEERRGTIPNGASKGERPTEVAARSRVGDWKGDTVAGKWQTACFMTSADIEAWTWSKRNSWLPPRNPEEIDMKQTRRTTPSQADLGNGEQLAARQAMAANSKAQVLFSHPHSPRERPAKENANGFLRRFFLSYSNSSTVTQGHFDHAIHLLNNRPQQHLS